MLKNKEIKNGAIVFNTIEGKYYLIQNVGNAIIKGDGNSSTTPNDELSYDIFEILTKKVFKGILEHSRITSDLTLATRKDVELYLAKLEANITIKLGKIKKQHNKILYAINHFIR